MYTPAHVTALLSLLSNRSSCNKTAVAWAIKCSNEQMIAYKETLKALGFKLGTALANANDMDGGKYLSYCTHNDDVYRTYGNSTATRKFNNIEEFLMWYFAPELTAEQKQILELEQTIKQAQQQIEQLKQIKK